MGKEIREVIKLTEEKEKLEKELEKMKIKDEEGGGRSLIVGFILLLIPFCGIITAESITGKMVCLGISLLILLIGFNWYNQTKKKKKTVTENKEEVKRVE